MPYMTWLAVCLYAHIATIAMVATANETKQDVALFEDDFSRYPPGPLTAPLGKLNGAIQEYHYLPHRGVELGPWANAICHIDAWVAGEQDGQPYLEQHLAPSHQDMVPKLFAPLFITGEPEWQDYTVEVSVCPLSASEFAGVVFRYHTNRHQILFSIENGKTARLAKRLPLEDKFRVCSWKELGSAEFPYETNRYYRLRVENSGPDIRAYIDDKLVLTANEDELVGGKVGLSANTPTRFKNFRVNVTPETKKAIDHKVGERQRELANLRASNPKPTLWKKFAMPKFGAGRNVRFGDLNGDGAIDMLVGQNVPKVVGDAAVEISCLTAVTLDGEVLWQMGRPDPRNGLLTCDTPFQIHDIDADGRNDVVMCKDFKLQVLDGRTGNVKQSTELPKIPGYPDIPQAGPRNWPYERANGDSIAFFNFSGDAARREILVKDRYWNFWIFDRNLKPLWSGQGSTGHYPFAYADPASGRDLLAIGYSLWDGAGKQLWSHDQTLEQHADSVFVGNITDNDGAPPMVYYCASDEGIILLDKRGVIRRQYRVGHAQTACVGDFRTDLPGLEYAAINFWRNPGIMTMLDARGELLQQEEPIHSGCPMLPVNWRGDGQEFILLSGNTREGGLVDGRFRRVVMFPDDGHPDLCAAVMNLTGDPRDEVILWDQEEVWIYTHDKPFATWASLSDRRFAAAKTRIDGNKIYAPQRNPHYNESNYRISVSWPAWQETTAATQ
jgi:rhamnogalacturonan endolyase